MLFPFLILAAAAAVTPADPVRLSEAEAREVLAVYEKDRADTRQWLKTSPTSYLAAVNRRDFAGKKTLTVGRARDNHLRIDDPTISDHHLRVTVIGDSFRVEAVDSQAAFVVDEEALRAATLPPTRIGVGRFTLRLAHQRFPGLTVFDPQSETFKDYRGIEYFEPDLSYRYVLPLTPNENPDTTIILSTRGNERLALRIGWFDFNVDGKPQRLEAHRLLEPGADESHVGLYFRDATCGNESYALGRYVNVEPLEDGRYVLDFNLAYNPACAYSPYYNCPIPPRANHLDVEIRAGEMDLHYLEH